MRHATWLTIERSPLWSSLYRNYRKLPDEIRAPLRWVASPQWQIIAALIRRTADNRVVSGPFKGMTVELSPVSQRHLMGYLLGTQELELAQVVEKIISERYDTLVNVGAADGYYAIGLARRMPQAKVIAFEALPDMLHVVKRVARLNGVSDRIHTTGKCDVSDLTATLAKERGKALVFMDIEGGEMTLLDPVTIPALKGTDIFVETHDCFVPDCTQTLMERFRDTHEIECFSARPRRLGDFPAGFLSFLPKYFPRLSVDLMDERRVGHQKWLFLRARR